MADITFEVVTETPQIESYASIGSAVFELYENGMFKRVAVFDMGYTEHDAMMACQKANELAETLRQRMAI